MLIAASLAACAPGAAPAVGEPAVPSSQPPAGQPGIAPIIVAVPTEPQPEPPVGAVAPPPAVTQENPMSGTPTLFGDISMESVDTARQDLARKLQVALDQVTVQSVIGQDFSVNAFYCRSAKDRIAKDDAPAAMSGFTILLSAAGGRYEYHASGPTVVFCRPVS